MCLDGARGWHCNELTSDKLDNLLEYGLLPKAFYSPWQDKGVFQKDFHEINHLVRFID